MNSSYRAGYCGLIGLPNAGKSSLMNWLIEDKVAIVSGKPQTTRQRIFGLWSEDSGQIVFVDAPGVLQFENRSGSPINRFLQREIEDVIAESDVLLLVLSIDTEKKEHLEGVLDLACKSGKPGIVVLMKAELGSLQRRLSILESEVAVKWPQAKVVRVSTKTPGASATDQPSASERGTSGLASDEEKMTSRATLRKLVLDRLPSAKGPLFDVEQLTTHPVRELVSEYIREQCFHHLHQEIPYETAVRILHFRDEGALIKIAAEILVSRDKYKGMVIGQGGAVIKKIGEESRKQIETLVGQKVFLDLQVLVRENWQDNDKLMLELGYGKKS